MALTNEPTDPLGNTVGTPELTGEVMRDSKMNECAKKKNQPSLHMAKAVKRTEGLKKGDSAQFHKVVCYVLEGAFCKLILWRKIITNRLLKKEYCSFNGKTLGAEEVHTTKLMGHGELNAHLPLGSLLVFVFAFYPNSALDST